MQISPYESVDILVKLAENQSKSLAEIVLNHQAIELHLSKEQIYKRMADNFQVMEESIQSGFMPDRCSSSGLSGGEAYKLLTALNKGETIGGRTLAIALARALAVTEVNASMGRIVAAPTAGSCGILPAAIITVMESHDIPRDRAIMSLFTAGGIGIV
ncbi:MAG: L-serine ammonia-lyase, iron-sulfur-dependent, subunit alpha, partial [Firmicutes bacterium]|nr:L-serine ammonia-lyase, iron-sulfur-dependent, subunit alpha [Bacillota bacterium]